MKKHSSKTKYCVKIKFSVTLNTLEFIGTGTTIFDHALIKQLSLVQFYHRYIRLFQSSVLAFANLRS